MVRSPAEAKRSPLGASKRNAFQREVKREAKSRVARSQSSRSSKKTRKRAKYQKTCTQPISERCAGLPAEGGSGSLMTSAASRLLREVRDISSQQIPVVFGEPEEADILHWRGMILGPPHTPYALGMFHFDLKFPQDYPNSAPKVLITTTSGGQVRFNPNLYATGKVCLSILGTWRAEHSGEQWSAVQSSQSILLSIQSLMNDAPYHNEPSFEADDGSGDVQRYNEKISHESVRVAVCEVMEDTVENRAVSSNGARRR